MTNRMKAAAIAPIVGLIIAAMALVLAPSVASADFGTDPTPNGLTITTYTGSLEDFQSDGEAWNLISGFATVDGEFVGYVFGAPDFVNDEFTEEFSEGLESEGLIVRAGDAPDMTPTPTETETATPTETATETPTATPTATGTAEM